MSRIRTLIRDARGVTAVEFAFVAPVMILLITGAIEMGHVISVRANLEGAVVEAARTELADLTKSEAERDAAMRARIAQNMSAYPVEPGKSIEIRTKVYANFQNASSEPYNDLDKNGTWTPAHGSVGAEPFTDRNGNGVWDQVQEKSGTMGGPGDVVSYTAVYPLDLYFSFLKPIFGAENGMSVSATAVVRNEPVVQKAVT